MKIMLIAIFAFGILAQAEAVQISNNTDATEGPSPVSTLKAETEETTSYTFYPPREEDESMLTTTLYPDNINSSYDGISLLFTEANTIIIPKTDNSLFYEKYTVFPETNFTVSSESSTTEFPKFTISQVSEVTPENPSSKCPEIGGPQVARSVVKCHCQGNEIYVNGKCQVYEGAIVIPVQHDWIYTEEGNMASYNVTVQDVSCENSIHISREFTKNQFHIRPRGDVVLLKEAGQLEDQRINNYCIFHHLDKHGELTWTMKACIPIPSVPRCCPPGKAMKEGKCEVANTPDVLKPPISAKPFSDGIDWESIMEYQRPVKCDSESEALITIPLGHKQSNLVSLADGVANGWVPDDTNKRRVYYKCPEYCVDGITNSAGSVGYFTSFCYSDPMETHKKACANGTCLRKCCKYGYSMDKNRYSCVPDSNSTSILSPDIDLSNNNIVTGFPLCSPVSKVEEKFTVDRMGSLILKDKELKPSDFCVDTFLDNEHREQSALACVTETPLWLKVRPYLFPICNVISVIFLMITIVIHLLVPKLLANGGLHQLCHVIALSIAYITSFSVHVFHNRFSDDVCVVLAIAMQFGFLSTFFWLNVMCFEIWRKIRRLKNYRPCKSYPNKYYMLYAWGIPFFICVITIFMQIYAPENVWGVIKPYIGVSRCWFREDIALLIYFYGPIAVLFLFNSVFLVLTYTDYKVLLRNYKETTNDLKGLGAGVTSEQRNLPSSTPSRQINDHVHDFNQKLKIFILMVICWVTEVLSWKIPPLELWALTDTFNSLQGFILFAILLSNSNKRKHLEKKYPRLFGWIKKCNRLPAIIRTWLQKSVNRTLTPMSSLTSSISSQFSNSTGIKTLITSIQSSNPSSSSFDVQTSESFDSPDEGVIVLSHSSLRKSDSTQVPADPSLQDFKSPEVTPDSAC